MRQIIALISRGTASFVGNFSGEVSPHWDYIPLQNSV